MLGLKDETYFNAMLNGIEDLDEKLSSYLDDDFLNNEDRQFFCISKTTHEKLVEEEIMVPHKGNFFDILIKQNI